MNTRTILLTATLASPLVLAACIPESGYGPGYGHGYNTGYETNHSASYAPPRRESHDRAIREAQEQHNERVHQLQHDFDKHRISERQLRDGVKQADHQLNGQLASLR